MAKKDKIINTSVKDARQFIRQNGNSKIEGINGRLKVLQRLDELRKSMPALSPDETAKLFS